MPDPVQKAAEASDGGRFARGRAIRWRLSFGMRADPDWGFTVGFTWVFKAFEVVALHFIRETECLVAEQITLIKAHAPEMTLLTSRLAGQTRRNWRAQSAIVIKASARMASSSSSAVRLARACRCTTQTGCGRRFPVMEFVASAHGWPSLTICPPAPSWSSKPTQAPGHCGCSPASGIE